MIFLFLFPLFFPKLNIDVSSSNLIWIYYKKKVEKAKRKEKKERKATQKISFLFVYNVSSLCAAHRHGHFVHLHQPLHITQYSLKKKACELYRRHYLFYAFSFFILSPLPLMMLSVCKGKKKFPYFIIIRPLSTLY